MVGTYAIGYIAVAFVPHVLALGLNSQLPRMRKNCAELAYMAAGVQAIMLIPVLAGLYLYSALFSASDAEMKTVFLVAMSGCLVGIFNVGLTLTILVQNVRCALVAPFFETALLLTGAVTAHSGTELAVYVLVGKAISVIAVWPRAGFRSVPNDEVLALMRNGTRYLALDLLAALNEQLPTAIFSMSLTRADLGLYRLCQQTLAAAEAPGWSYVQSQYPALTSGEIASARKVAKNMVRFGTLGSAFYLLGSLPAALFAFRTPALLPMMAVLSPALFSRYIIYFGDQRLRAVGKIRQAVTLSSIRLATTSVLTASVAKSFGIWGAVWITTSVSIAFSILYKTVNDIDFVGPNKPTIDVVEVAS
jgi:O-antigen/teichoic acid export membrane protein